MALLRLIRLGITAGKVALTVAVGYLSVLTIAALRTSRTKAGPGRTPSNRFAVLIPAHDEERLIGSTLQSLSEMDYPPGLVSVHVVADHCADSTADLVRASGYRVHERNDPEVPGKGPSLQWLLARVAATDEHPDAYVFIDADTTVARSFLREIDKSLAAGNDVVQAHYAVRDPDDSPVVAFRAAALAARTYLRPLGRNAIGGSAGLYGNGMAFRPDVLRDRGWSDHLTEDIELHLDLLLGGVRVAFAPHARIEAEMPTTLEAARTQNERWERGRIDLARRYLPALARRTVTGGPAGRVAYADAMLDQAVPPFSVLAAATTAWTGSAALLALVSPRRRRGHGLGVSATLTAAQVVYVLSALRLIGAPRSVYRSLLGAPRMVAWKLALLLRVAGRRSAIEWVRTTRN